MSSSIPITPAVTGAIADTEAYVRSAARFLALPLDDAQVQRVATQLARTRLLAESLAAVPLDPELELAEVYCPAPFPPADA